MKAVFFDVDDTLVDYQLAARSAFVAALGSDAGFTDFHALPHYQRFLDGEVDFETARTLRMADFLRLIGRDEDAPRAAEIERARFTGLPLYYELYDDVLPCLTALRERGLLLGLITNNESVHQRAKIAAVGLDRLVDAVAISEEVGGAQAGRADLRGGVRAARRRPRAGRTRR